LSPPEIARRALAVLVAWLAGIGTAAAHAGEGAEILLLPTELYIIGGALAVAISFCVLALFHRQRKTESERPERPAHTVPSPIVRLASLVSLIFLIILITAGFAGKPDPLANPLPLAIWTLWWMGFTLLVAIAGNLWTIVNPWIGLYDLIGRRALLTYPERLGYLPAALLFFGFTWFELIFVTPQDPGQLAVVVTAYWLVNFVGLLVFGPRWLERGEAFSGFFAMAGHFSPLQWRMINKQERPQVTLRPGWPEETDRRDFADLTGVLFILVTLASVTFDGLSRTFTWIGWLGLNPLEFPGRSAVLWQNSAGLILCIAALGAFYALAVELGPYRTRLVPSRPRALGCFVLSLVPISIAYHLAHYLPSLIVGLPSGLLALADPFGRGWSWWPHDMVHAGSAMGLGYDRVILIYRVQTAIIVIGHIVATLTAHRLALAETKDRLKAVTSEIPLAVLMVGYTLLGLWLLSTPQIG
jgi:hypothetical protein